MFDRKKGIIFEPIEKEIYRKIIFSNNMCNQSGNIQSGKKYG